MATVVSQCLTALISHFAGVLKIFTIQTNHQNTGRAVADGNFFNVPIEFSCNVGNKHLEI